LAGHNKWSKIRHRKAVVDKRRSKVWSKVSRNIIVAARHGGPDPNFNLSLRYAIDEARYANMPRDVIERAIKKGAGGEDLSAYEAIRYEGYGPGGVAIIVDALTDNRTRTITDVRNAFADHEGNVGASGCVAYMFQPRGRIVLAGQPEGKARLTEDRVMEAAINAGAVDVGSPDVDAAGEDCVWVVMTEAADFHRVREALEKDGFQIVEAELALIPDTTMAVPGDAAEELAQLIEELEELEDVQKVFSNAGD
jgi:YebC/PmpR family DNA-binding regulatory protein